MREIEVDGWMKHGSYFLVNTKRDETEHTDDPNTTVPLHIPANNKNKHSGLRSIYWKEVEKTIGFVVRA